MFKGGSVKHLHLLISTSVQYHKILISLCRVEVIYKNNWIQGSITHLQYPHLYSTSSQHPLFTSCHSCWSTYINIVTTTCNWSFIPICFALTLEQTLCICRTTSFMSLCLWLHSYFSVTSVVQQQYPHLWTHPASSQTWWKASQFDYNHYKRISVSPVLQSGHLRCLWKVSVPGFVTHQQL